MSQIDEIALLLAEINGDSPYRRSSYLNGTTNGPGSLHIESSPGGGGESTISPLPTTPSPCSKKSLKLRKIKQPVRFDRNPQLSMPKIEGDSPDMFTLLPTQCPFPGPFSTKWCGEGLECSGRERNSEFNINEQTGEHLEESIGGEKMTGLFHRERVLKYVSATCLPLLENYVSSWVSRMVEEIVKMNTEQRQHEVTTVDVGNALEEVWQNQMASWTNYDDDNNSEYLVDAPPRLTNVLKEEYWTTVFSKIYDLDTLRALLNPVEAACTKEFLLAQKRKSCTYHAIGGKLSAFRKPYEI